MDRQEAALAIVGVEERKLLAAVAEAAAHFGSAVALVPRLDPGPDRDRREAVLQTSLATALALAHGYTHEASGAAYRRAVEICKGRATPTSCGRRCTGCSSST